ncbi:protocatechuate 3,4-dioxygenase subunit alpha [Nocardioides carbamazepini]|uniref:protocatechuate 3,4-dioxygenase subunit alpha n=1 Tax=Nocardioides carbamazepini TaxID=2854259 RepID=UPI00214A0F79|nr:protocatechuate 3,4-dioxygenase subunit alpha [Nocardioides carbamazepini]MCR1785734.1 protocatechuate 3,4-dioxygenase subunit alpha [Nocardioides carbamazepini]
MSETLAPTPGQTIGPFFHDALPYPGDSLLVPPGSAGAVRLHGTVYDGSGAPVPDALVELRQADPAGRVPRVEGSLRRDGRFTGWGRAATDAAGRYAFTTVTPGGADGGAAFFAVTVFARGLLDRLFTRAYLPGESDAFLAGLPADDAATLRVLRDTRPGAGTGAGPGDLRFDIHLQGERETVFLRYPRHAFPRCGR